MSLRDKSLHELRAIAQGYGVDKLFELSYDRLVQEIELAQEEMMPAPAVEVPMPQYDARLMLKAPSRKSSKEEVEQMLQPFFALGMHLTWMNDEEWRMQLGAKENTGTIRQPLRNIVKCAQEIIR